MKIVLLRLEHQTKYGPIPQHTCYLTDWLLVLFERLSNNIILGNRIRIVFELNYIINN